MALNIMIGLKLRAALNNGALRGWAKDYAQDADIKSGFDQPQQSQYSYQPSQVEQWLAANPNHPRAEAVRNKFGGI